MVTGQEIMVSLPLALALGLIFGLSACAISCLPYLGPVFMASEGGIRQSWRIVLPFSLGRLCGYAGLGLVAGMAGHYLGEGVGTANLRWVSGGAAVMVGLALWPRRHAKPSCCGGAPTGPGLVGLGEKGRPSTPILMPGGLFLMGAGMALTPCAPLGIVLFSAAFTASAFHGMALGLAFGLGAIAIPALLFGVGMAYLGSRLREQLGRWRHVVQYLSAALLIAVGLKNLLV